ncbi:MAG: DUF805 domain-containing protein [Alphaproteobacteria bacterium]|nr:DUF805 domain-containing protein [Alphaproteobacteria bacterium]
MNASLFSFRGRAPRRDYWIFTLVMFVLMVVGVLADSALAETDSALSEDEEVFPVVTMIILLVMTWPGLAMTCRRWHDRDKSGWWMLISLVPLIGPLWALIENGFLAGSPGDNRFGPPPYGSAPPLSASPPPPPPAAPEAGV